VSLRLPDNLFTAHRLIQDGESRFRLSDQYRETLLEGSEVRLPAALPDPELPPLLAIPLLVRHLSGMYGHFVRMPDAARRLDSLIQRIALLSLRSPDGCIAAMLLCSSSEPSAQHAIHCALLAAHISRSLAWSHSEAKTLIGCALTMNLSSAEVQDQMDRQEGPPSTLQRQLLDIHPLLSSAMLREVGINDDLWHATVLMHHARNDAHGYAFGASPEDIPPAARLIHLLDTVTAKLTPRAYRHGLIAQQALAALYAGERERFEPRFLTPLIKILGVYPPGSFVELENGAHALVVRHGASATTPQVVPIKSPDQTLDSAQPGFHVRRAVAMSMEARHLSLFYPYWR